MAWNICLVSDNEAIQHLFTRTFVERKDVSLKFCATAEEAVKEASKDSIHLMIASVTLPDKDGYDLCQELKEEVKVDFPVLLIEDIFEDIDLDRCLEVQTDGFIAKPFEEALIAEKVDEVLQNIEKEAPQKVEEEELKEMTSLPEEEVPVSAMLSAEEEEEEGIMELTELVEDEEAAPALEEAPAEKEEVPPSIAAALEESVSEMEKMEAMETEAPEEEEGMEEVPPERPLAEEAGPAVPAIGREEIEKMVTETVEQVVQRSIEEKLPGILKETLAKLFTDLSGALK